MKATDRTVGRGTAIRPLELQVSGMRLRVAGGTALRRVPGVIEASVNPATERALVRFAAGAPTLMHEEGVQLGVLETEAERLQAQGRTVSLVAENGRLRARWLSATGSSRERVRPWPSCGRAGRHVVLLSGTVGGRPKPRDGRRGIGR